MDCAAIAGLANPRGQAEIARKPVGRGLSQIFVVNVLLTTTVEIPLPM